MLCSRCCNRVALSETHAIPHTRSFLNPHPVSLHVLWGGICSSNATGDGVFVHPHARLCGASRVFPNSTSPDTLQQTCDPDMCEALLIDTPSYAGLLSTLDLPADPALQYNAKFDYWSWGTVCNLDGLCTQTQCVPKNTGACTTVRRGRTHEGLAQRAAKKRRIQHELVSKYAALYHVVPKP